MFIPDRRNLSIIATPPVGAPVLGLTAQISWYALSVAARVGAAVTLGPTLRAPSVNQSKMLQELVVTCGFIYSYAPLRARA